MKEWGDKQDLLRRVEQARRDARDHVFPKDAGNETVEAALFIASVHAFMAWTKEESEAAATDESGQPVTVTEDSPLPPEASTGIVPAPVKLPENTYDTSG